ncbi:MAG: catalase [Lachnospiraceae bacterium]|jgi:hypothetical protein|nr:catalase [Lachnospiraceae bacterium]
MKAFQHFCTITRHRLLVMKYCFKIGLYWQGLTHDLSKYSPAEFLPGCRYYQGFRSPNNAEREEKGYSSAWLHHKGRNKHHYEYWIDYSLRTGRALAGMKMPVRYVAEMMMDRIAASRIYKGDAYDERQPLCYYEQGKEAYVIHEETRELLEYLLRMLAVQGEEKTLAYIRRNLVGKKEYPNLPKKRGN